MKWLQNAFTRRFNVRHRQWGRVFGDRYKAVLVDAGSGWHAETVLDYIHLNPVRARLIRPDGGQSVLDFPWSSVAGGYVLSPGKRVKWLETSAGFAAAGAADTVAGRMTKLAALTPAFTTRKARAFARSAERLAHGSWSRSRVKADLTFPRHRARCGVQTTIFPAFRHHARRRKAVSLALLCLALPLHRGRADIIPDGYRGISHEIFIEGGEKFPDWTFVLYPTSLGGSQTWKEIKSGEEQNFYHMLSPKIYAVRREAPPPADNSFFDNAGVPRSEVEVSSGGVVPDSDPTHRMRTVYRITGVEGSLVKVTLEPDLRFDATGKQIAPEIAAVVVAEAEGTRSQWLIGAAGGVLVILAAIGLLRARRGGAAA